MVTSWSAENQSCREKKYLFSVIYAHAKKFASNVQDELIVADIDVEIELDIPEKRIPIAKRKNGEKCSDHIRQAVSKGCKADDHQETVSEGAKLYETKTFNIIMDSMRQQLGDRFVINETLLHDLAFFDPRNFKKMQRSGIPEGALVLVSKVSHIERNSLAKELRQFSIYYEDYKKDLLASKITTIDSKDSDDDETYE